MTEITAEKVVATASALKRVAEILADEPAGSVVRLSVNGGGCSGFQYNFDIVAASEPEDIVLGEGPGRLAIDPVSLDFLKGSEIDFIDDLMGASFRVNNPNATASCGCGSSFSI